MLLAQMLQQNKTCMHTHMHTCNVFYPFGDILFYLLVLKITHFLLRENDTKKRHQFGMQNDIGFPCLPNSYSAAPVRSLCRWTFKLTKSNSHCFQVLKIRHIFSTQVI